MLENIVDFDLQRQRRKELEGKVYSGACSDSLVFSLGWRSPAG